MRWHRSWLWTLQSSFLDEPTTGQDAASILRIAEIVTELKRDGKSVVTITHDIDFCAENFKRLIVMGKGKVLLDGPMHQILAQDEILRSTYVDPPQLTRLGWGLGLPGIVCNQDEFIRPASTARNRPEFIFF